jgi:rhamnosyltransferase
LSNNFNHLLSTNISINDSVKVAAIVVLYHPSTSITTCINSYINQVDYVYIIDNTENIDNIELLNTLKNDNWKYIPLFNNFGIATALNRAIRSAITDGYNYVLTMDQDSQFIDNAIMHMKNTFNLFDRTGIVAPNNGYINIIGGSDYFEVLFTMASGSLIKTSAYIEIGGFEDKLFIDHVDHDFCLKLKNEGYKIIICKSAILLHQLGCDINSSLFNHKKSIVYHNPERLYYFTRNGIYVSIKFLLLYPLFSCQFICQMVKEFIKIVLVYKNKHKYITSIIKGVFDVFGGKYGR